MIRLLNFITLGNNKVIMQGKLVVVGFVNNCVCLVSEEVMIILIIHIIVSPWFPGFDIRLVFTLPPRDSTLLVRALENNDISLIVTQISS